MVAGKPSLGTIVLLDLDRFGEYVEKHGYSRYSPNEVTGLLTHLVERLVSKYQGVILYGLDYDRGTEEAVIVFPHLLPEEISDDLSMIADEICKLKSSLTIVALLDYVHTPRSMNRREAYNVARRAKTVLERLKRRGGGVVWINGSVHYKCDRELGS